jgi:hypothetical protein
MLVITFILNVQARLYTHRESVLSVERVLINKIMGKLLIQPKNILDQKTIKVAIGDYFTWR